MAIEQARRLAVEELAKMPISAFRNAVAGALAVVDAQRRLRFEPTGDLVQDMLNAALDIVRAVRAPRGRRTGSDRHQAMEQEGRAARQGS